MADATGDPIYLDLFDDGIPVGNIWTSSPEPKNSAAVFADEVQDTLRLQILIAILLGRRIVVPEAWMVSSPIFLRVAGEVMAGFNSLKSLQAAWPFLFAFSKLDSNDKTLSPSVRLTKALHWRLSTNRRMMFSPRLASGSGEKDIQSLRKSTAAALEPFLSSPNEFSQHKIPSVLARALLKEDSAGNAVQQYSKHFDQIYEHLERDTLGKMAYDFDEPLYKTRLTHEIDTVRKTVQFARDQADNDELGADPEIKSFSEFFKGVPEEIELSKIMALWANLDQLDAPRKHKQTVEAFGRYVLNRAYARSLRAADLGSVSFAAYSAKSTTHAGSELVQRVLTAERRARATDIVASRNVPDFVALATLQPYDLKDVLTQGKWENIWRRAAACSTDIEWQNIRSGHLNKLRGLSARELESPDAWTDLFDAMAAATGGNLKFRFNGKPADPAAIASVVVAWEALKYSADMDQTMSIALTSIISLTGILGNSVIQRSPTAKIKALRQVRAATKYLDRSASSQMFIVTLKEEEKDK